MRLLPGLPIIEQKNAHSYRRRKKETQTNCYAQLGAQIIENYRSQKQS